MTIDSNTRDEKAKHNINRESAQYLHYHQVKFKKWF